MKIGKKSVNFEQIGKKKSPLSSNGDLISLIVSPQTRRVDSLLFDQRQFSGLNKISSLQSVQVHAT